MRSDSLADALAGALRCAGNSWKQAKRQADRNDRVRSSDLQRLRYQPRETYICEAVERVMAKAYLHASGDGQYPANARQVMYAARPLVLELTGGRGAWKNSAYFTQVLLPKYLEDHPEETAGWDIVYDARGHLYEPHEGETAPLGTLEVRQYIGNWYNGRIQTSELKDLVVEIPSKHRYNNVAFFEKEGFNELLRQARIAERFDVAIMSTKGMTVTACRSLIDHFSETGVRVFVAHDFDKAGLGIFHTMVSDSARYTYANTPDVIELGLRLADVEEMKLDSEPVNYPSDPTYCLEDYGCTDAEVKFLHSGYRTGRRVELNAMTSPQFVAWLEAKLKKHGVTKFVPGDEVLEVAFRHAYLAQKINAEIDKVFPALRRQAANVNVPPDLGAQVRKALARHARRTWPWTQVISDIAANADNTSPQNKPHRREVDRNEH